MPPRSKIAKLPRATREKIDAFLRHRDAPPSVDQFHRFLVEDLGVDLARSSAHLHMQQWERAAARVRKAREVAERIGLDITAGQESRALRVLVEMVQSEAINLFEALEDGEQLGPGEIVKLSLALKSIAQALHHDAAREKEIRRRVVEEVVDKAIEAARRAAKTAGVTLGAEALEQIRGELGLLR